MSIISNTLNFISFVVYIHSATVSEVSAVALSSTAVSVSWTPVNLTVVDHYTVHYTTVGGVNGTITFPVSASSGVVSGLQEGQQYQFSVTVTLNILFNGKLFRGSPDYTQSKLILCENKNYSCMVIIFMLIRLSMFLVNTSTPMVAAPVSTSSGVIGWVLFAVTLVGSSIIITILVVCLVVLRQQLVKQKRYILLCLSACIV